MISNPQNKYLETTIQTATPAQLLIMLCDGAIRFCKQGIDSIEKNNPEDANKYLVKVQNIIQEFIITLDHKSPLADNLLKLYEYFLSRLIEANIKKDVEPAKEVLGHLQELKETWMQAALSMRAGVKNG